MVHSHAVHLALGALLTPCTTCGTGLLTPSLAALAAQVTVFGMSVRYDERNPDYFDSEEEEAPEEQELKPHPAARKKA